MIQVREEKLSSEEITRRYNAIELIKRDAVGPAHSHPDSEYVEVKDGFVIINWLLNDGQILSNSIFTSAVVDPEVPHQYTICGNVAIYTTINNLENLVKKPNLENFND